MIKRIKALGFKRATKHSAIEKTSKTNVELPYLFIAGYFESSNKKDAVQYVRNLMENICSSLDHAGYMVTPYSDGFAYEIHEGGSRRSYLKWIITKLAESTQGKIAFKTAKQVVSIEKSSRGFVTLLIPESCSHKESLLVPAPDGAPLTRYAIDKTKLVTALMYVFGVGVAVLGLSILSKTAIVMAKTDAAKQEALKKREQLPVLHWPKEKLPDNAYIDKLTYSNGRWNVLAKAVANEPRQDPGKPVPKPMDGSQQKRVTHVPTLVNGKIIDKAVISPGVNPR